MSLACNNKESLQVGFELYCFDRGSWLRAAYIVDVVRVCAQSEVLLRAVHRVIGDKESKVFNVD